MKAPADPHTFQYSDIAFQRDGTLRVGGIKGVPDISGSNIGELAAWFLGPRAENQDLLREMIDLAIDQVAAYRQEFGPEDPQVVTEEVKKTESYQQAVRNMNLAYESLIRYLQRYTTPYFSMRYQAHMLWDNTLPALAAYFATMLHNPNNVTIQASSATTPLEILVGWDLCGMVGFPVRRENKEKEYNPWGHLTCDGSVANIEAFWAAREVKFLPFALRRMLETCPVFLVDSSSAKSGKVVIDNQKHPIEITTCNGTSFCLTGNEVDSWQLFNIPQDEILRIPAQIAEKYGIANEYVIWSTALPYTLNYIGWQNMSDYIRSRWPNTQMPVLLGPSSMHYSLPKAAALTGYGFGSPEDDVSRITGGSLIKIPVDGDGRQDLVALEKVLDHCLLKRIPIAQAIAVVGTTEEGAVDPLSEMVAARKRYQACGLEYSLHADCAWGGYIITSMRKPYTLENSIERAEKEPDIPPYKGFRLFVRPEESPLSDYVYQQFGTLHLCDSVTIDPHKMGYVQYPAGAILYRNGVLRRLTTFTGAYIGGTGSIDPGKEPTVGIFGIEGSKPGAAAAAVFMNHRVIRPDVTGHGKIIRQCLENTRLFALYLMAMSERSEHYRVTLLFNPEKWGMRLHDCNPLKMNQQQILSLFASGEFRNFGPDLNILDYVFTPLDDKGAINLSTEELNDFNNAVYDLFHVPVADTPEKTIPVSIEDFPDYFLTRTVFHEQEYGRSFLDSFLQRIFPEGNIRGQSDSVVCLRSVVMDPFMPYAKDGDFFRTIIAHIDASVIRLVQRWRKERGRSY